jgi:hypothetical protein
LRTHFGTPPNVFDGFRVQATEQAERAAQVLVGERDILARKATELEQRLGLTVAENQQLAEAERASRDRIAELTKERSELTQALLKTRLWVGQLSQELAASRLQQHG